MDNLPVEGLHDAGLYPVTAPTQHHTPNYRCLKGIGESYDETQSGYNAATVGGGGSED